jgi:CheY-like chemotaxis protein
MSDARKDLHRRGAFLTAWDALRAAHHVLWTLHWQAEGTPSYGDHLLYKRLYKARVEEIDRVAELIAALFGASALDAVASWDRATPFIGLGAKRPAPERATLVVEAAMEAVEAAIAAIKKKSSGPVVVGKDPQTGREVTLRSGRFGTYLEVAQTEAEGYAATGARGGTPGQALARFEGAPQDFDLVVSDIKMPDRNGYEVFAAARHLDPDMPDQKSVV